MNTAAIIWLALMAVFLIVEAACPIHLVSAWFAVGALVAAIAGQLGAQVWLQVVLFLAVSGSLLAALWPFVKKFLTPSITKTNVDSIIDSQGYVTASIDNLSAQGQVKLGAMEWSARSTNGESIPQGTLIRVDRIEGVKVFVTPVEEKVEI